MTLSLTSVVADNIILFAIARLLYLSLALCHFPFLCVCVHARAYSDSGLVVAGVMAEMDMGRGSGLGLWLGQS